jgi:hypothetical protein
MPVAGILKRIKSFAPKLLTAANSVNKFYKSFEPIIDVALDAIPYGSIGKQVLHGVSKGIDLVDNVSQVVKKKSEANKPGYTSQPKNNELLFGQPINQTKNSKMIQPFIQQEVDDWDDS